MTNAKSWRFCGCSGMPRSRAERSITVKADAVDKRGADGELKIRVENCGSEGAGLKRNTMKSSTHFRISSKPRFRRMSMKASMDSP